MSHVTLLMRLFFALPLPEPVMQAVSEVSARLRAELPGSDRMRWVQASNLHLTLKFLGEIEPRYLPVLEARMRTRARQASAISALISGLAAFPSARQARVLVLTIRGAGANLESLSSALNADIAECGIAPESRPFHPHLTLARLPVPRNLRAELASFSFDPIHVQWHEIVLYRSKLGAGGSSYEIMARSTLGSA